MERVRRKIRIHFYVDDQNKVFSLREPAGDVLKNAVLISIQDCDLIDRARVQRIFQTMVDKAFSTEIIG